MADTTFQGVIELTADTTKAEKKVEELEKKKGGSTPSSGGSASGGGTTLPDASAISSNVKQIVSAMGNLFGGFGRTGAGAFNNAFSNIQAVGKLFGAGAQGAAKAATAAGQAAAAAGTTGASGAAAGAGAAAAPALAALGPIGIAVGTVAALGAVSVGVAVAFKAATEQVMDFARTLATVSPSMAVTFAQFDRQMMIIKQQMGEMLAPAINDMLNSIVGFVQGIAPYVALFTMVLSEFIATVINVMDKFIKWAESHKAIVGGVIGGMAFGLGGIIPGANIAGGGGDGAGKANNPLEEIRETIKSFFEAWKINQNRNASAMVMQDFMRQINAEGSAQRQYQDRFYNPNDGGYAFHTPVPIVRGP